ncbi:hypothetical protein EII20_04700 [Comamonadaceae bacterium OH2545_COT-014]|nr:hypothetical protein EII20_04700 [Comamonadaceae bacterium OH2545_COT-014]
MARAIGRVLRFASRLKPLLAHSRRDVEQLLKPIRCLPLALALLAPAALPAHAQTAGSPTAHPPPAPQAAACPNVAQLSAADLYGAWHFQLATQPQPLRGTLVLKQHPEFSASLRGEIDWGHGVTAIASGDVENGEFNLDESRDGKSLAAFWSGQLTPAACGHEIRGAWQPLPGRTGTQDSESAFVLQRSHGPRPAPRPAAAVPQAETAPFKAAPGASAPGW